MGMFSQLVSMATKALSGRSGTNSSHGRPSSDKGQMARTVGTQVVEQVRKAGPDAAQRHLSKTRFGSDPRARRAAKAADDLARRLAGTAPAGSSTNTAGTVERTAGDREDETRVNRYGERP